MDIEFRKVVKGKSQDRVTIPKRWNADYVAIKPVNIPNVFKEKNKSRN